MNDLGEIHVKFRQSAFRQRMSFGCQLHMQKVGCVYIG